MPPSFLLWSIAARNLKPEIVVRICADFTPNCSFLVTSTKLSGMIDFDVAVNIRYWAKLKIGANGQNFCVSLFF